MSYQLHAPTEDPVVLELRAEYRRLGREQDEVLSKLDKVLPTPFCRLCKVNKCRGSLDWTVCAPCWNKHGGKPPPP